MLGKRPRARKDTNIQIKEHKVFRGKTRGTWRRIALCIWILVFGAWIAWHYRGHQNSLARHQAFAEQIRAGEKSYQTREKCVERYKAVPSVLASCNGLPTQQQVSDKNARMIAEADPNRHLWGSIIAAIVLPLVCLAFFGFGYWVGSRPVTHLPAGGERKTVGT